MWFKNLSELDKNSSNSEVNWLGLQYETKT